MKLSMRHLSGVGLALVLALCAGAVAFAQDDPRREQKRLTPADMALAKRITVQQADLGPGWKRVPATKGGDEPLECPGFNPDLSAFTITGEAQSEFQRDGAITLASIVEVYESRADAAGDFRASARPALATCLRTTLEKEIAKDKDPTLKVSGLSSRMLKAPRVAERSAAWRLVASVSVQGVSAKVYVDLLAFVKSRSIAALLFVAPARPVAGQAALARVVAARMR